MFETEVYALMGVLAVPPGYLGTRQADISARSMESHVLSRTTLRGCLLQHRQGLAIVLPADRSRLISRLGALHTPPRALRFCATNVL